MRCESKVIEWEGFDRCNECGALKSKTSAYCSRLECDYEDKNE